uniref:separin isoform X2 n=1 Tax=Myxine glutinosa TaxID=7769 RepID=UPI00358E1714
MVRSFTMETLNSRQEVSAQLRCLQSLSLGRSEDYLGLVVMLVDLQLPHLMLTQSDAVDKVLDIAQAAVESFGTILAAQNGDDAKRQAFSAGAVAFNLSRGLLQQGLYLQALRFGRLACKQAESAFVLVPDKSRVLRYITLYVELCRKAGCYREGLQAVADGCWILRDDLQCLLPTLLALWGKVKVDGVMQGNMELQLLTVADFLGHREPKRDLLVTVLQAELRHCKAQRGDTAQERYNIICDLLELCPEGSSQPLDRVHHLLEFTQLLCYCDFSSQTDCTTLDCLEEVMSLLESLQEENVEGLDPGHVVDLKAIAHLWLYIVHVEDAAAKAGKKDAVQEKVPVLELDNVNDLNAEEKQNEDPQLHSNLSFLPTNEAENLDLALELWRDVLSVIELKTLYCPSTTLLSLQILAQLFRLIGKPLHALRACQLVERLAEVMGNLQTSVMANCQAATLLLELQVPSYAQLFVDKAEAELQFATEAGEDLTLLQETLRLTQSYWLLSTGQMELGCQCLQQLLAELSLHRPSKACYVLKAKAWMLASFYLQLPPSRLDTLNRQSLLQQVPTGESSALGLAVAAHRLLVGVVSLLLGPCYLRLQPADLLDADANTPKASVFLPQGDSLMMKWSLLSELLWVTCHVTTLQDMHGNNLEAMGFCQEALKLASKLQLSRRCAFLLVTKAGLEAQKGYFEDCSLDLCRLASFVNANDASEPRRGNKIACPARLQHVWNTTEAQPDEESPNNDKMFALPELGQVIVRRHAAQPTSPNASPVLHRRVKPCGPWTHKYCCHCPWCSDPMYLWVAVEWACVQSRLEEADDGKTSLHILLKAQTQVEKLVRVIDSKLQVMVGALPQHVCNGSQSEKPETCWALKAKVLYHLSCTELTLRSFCHLKEHAEMATKLMSLGVHDHFGLGSHLLLLRASSQLVRLSARQGCSLVELFSQFWGIGFMVEPLAELQEFVSDIQKSEETQIHSQTVKISAQRPSRTNKKPLQKSVRPNTGNTPNGPRLHRLAQTSLSDFKTPARATRCTAKTAKVGISIFVDEPERKLPDMKPLPKRKPQSFLQPVVFSDSEDEEEHELFRGSGRKLCTYGNEEKGKNKNLDGEFVQQVAVSSGIKRTRKKVVPPKNRQCATVGGNAACSSQKAARVPSDLSTHPKLNLTPVVWDDEQDEKNWMLGGPCTRPIRTSHHLDTDLQSSHVSDVELERRQSEPDCSFLEQITCEEQSTSTESSWLRPTEGLSMEDVCLILEEAWALVAHDPPYLPYRLICQLLALRKGDENPWTTAWLINESIAIALRHRAVSNVQRKLQLIAKKKLEMKESAVDSVTSQIGSLRIADESAVDDLRKTCEVIGFQAGLQGLTGAVEAFRNGVNCLFADVAVCTLAAVNIHPEEISCAGGICQALLLTRLERGCAPVNICLHPGSEQVGLASIMRDFDAILREQQVVNELTERQAWWQGRRALDARLENLMAKLENDVLGCWMGLLLPPCKDSSLRNALFHEAEALRVVLTKAGGQVPRAELLQAVLAGSSHLVSHQLQVLTKTLAPAEARPSFQCALVAAVTRLRKLDMASQNPRGSVVLILDKHLHRLPWESIPILRESSITRMPCLSFLLATSAQASTPGTVLNTGVNPQKAYYVLNPQANLPSTESTFRQWFESMDGWEGAIGKLPNQQLLQLALSTKDLYIYAGHGAGARLLGVQELPRLSCRAPCLLFGCSSAALTARGSLEPSGIALSYMMAGCPCVLGNLWDVTDRDIDRYTEQLLRGWLSSAGRKSLPEYLSLARTAPKLPFLTGAAPIIYGLPIHCL